ncbi:MAG TPA: DUF4258 domain-containing protein, partial [Anaeromyxobacter sp.]|nr:DUF4258 domain-containing protein [Anaeromyxobacter sp.]
GGGGAPTTKAAKPAAGARQRAGKALEAAMIAAADGRPARLHGGGAQGEASLRGASEHLIEHGVDKSASRAQRQPVTPAEALHEIRGYAGAGRYSISSHAWKRMSQRGVRTRDVREALCSARTCHAEADERWKVTGQDLDGEDLTLVVVIEDVVVVTLF